MSNGTNEPLPGLLDDPQFQIDLPWNDLPIAPLRNPAPQRNANAPSPLEPEAGASANPAPTRSGGGSERRGVGSRQNITPNDVLQARESRKPHLAISELVDDNEEPGSHSTQLPSFVSLSVVEKSPTQAPQPLSRPMQKRPRLEDEHPHDLGRQLPRPAQREQIVHRPAPLLPAMVTGLHEPPPSANLLPSMDADQRSGATRSAATSKIQVKDILMPTDTSRSPSPARQLPSLHSKPPHLPHLDFPPPRRASTEPTPPTTSTSTPVSATIPSTRDGSKPRRIRRKWTDDETRDLLAGVRKHGVGKWKQILTDPSYTFDERSAVDLKDRYRVCSKDELNGPAAAAAAAATSKSPANTDPSPNSPGSDHPASRGASPAPGSGPQKQRRKRRAWTTEEDDALLRGVSKHGFQWTVIHDDEALSLSHRRATDLRDRIRNKFPEGYRLAESKPLRSEIKRVEREREREREERDRAFASDDVQQAKGKEPASQPSAAAAAAGGGSGVTLPSLSLDDMDDMDMDADEGIRLPPLLPWDDMTN